jgi:hypothetical protein
VIAQGKLLTHDGRSFVDIKHISILGLPWGVLDTLYELEAVLVSDVQALVAALTQHEKSQMNQSVDKAMRELIEMRLSKETVETECSDVIPEGFGKKEIGNLILRNNGPRPCMDSNLQPSDAKVGLWQA